MRNLFLVSMIFMSMPARAVCVYDVAGSDLVLVGGSTEGCTEGIPRPMGGIIFWPKNEEDAGQKIQAKLIKKETLFRSSVETNIGNQLPFVIYPRDHDAKYKVIVTCMGGDVRPHTTIITSGTPESVVVTCKKPIGTNQ